jgi:putative DNA methylase
LVEDGFILSGRGKVRLLSRAELDGDWDPRADDRLTVWEVTQHLVRLLDKEGETGAAVLLRKLGALGETARDLAYRLYSTSERKGWAEDAVAYNSLVVAWPQVARMAASSAESLLEQTSLLSETSA